MSRGGLSVLHEIRQLAHRQGFPVPVADGAAEWPMFARVQCSAAVLQPELYRRGMGNL